MALYAALLYNPADLRGHEDPEILREYAAFIEEATAAGVLRGGEPLVGTESATTVTIPDGRKDGEVVTMDGPFAETKDILAGFFLLECDDLDHALDWASRVPATWHGKVEVRPVARTDTA